MTRDLRATPATKGLVATVGTTAVAKVVVMGLSGLLGLFTSRLIIGHFGTDVYAQYGLLSSFPALLPFADLGMATIVINAVAASTGVHTDEYVRNAITTAMRVLVIAGLIIVSLATLITALDLWPTLLGEGLLPGGSLGAFACLAVFGLVLPLTVGPRIMVGLNKTAVQTAVQAVVAPFIFASVALAVATRAPVGTYLGVLSYLAQALVAVICLFLAAAYIKPQIRHAIRDVPRLRRVPNVPVMAMAWPMLVQLVAMPLALQSDRLLLSHLTTGQELAQYNLSAQLFGMVLQSITAGGLALWPFYARARTSGHVRSPFRPTLVFALCGLSLAVVLALLSPWIARFVSGGRITLDAWLLGGFVVFVALQATKYPLGMYMTDQRGLQFQVIPLIILVPVNLGLSWWLIGVVGAGGPIIGSAVSVLLCQVLPDFWYVRRDLARRRLLGAGHGDGHVDDESRVG